MADDDNFFSRWSRRKVQKQAGEAVPEAPVAAVPSAATKAATTAAPKPVPPLSAPAAPAQGDTPPAVQEKAPPPTLADVAKLTKDSDFSRFVGVDVSPDVRNAAMKKLFADPHFNVMDGLDIYIDDYSSPSPMSKDFARTLASAKFMKLFDEPEQPDAKAQPQAEVAGAEPAQITGAQDSQDPQDAKAPEGANLTTPSGIAEPSSATHTPTSPSSAP